MNELQQKEDNTSDIDIPNHLLTKYIGSVLIWAVVVSFAVVEAGLDMSHPSHLFILVLVVLPATFIIYYTVIFRVVFWNWDTTTDDNTEV